MGSRNVSELPNEILFSIFSYLKLYDLKYHVPAVCKRWEILSKDRRLWKKLTYETRSGIANPFGSRSWESTLRFLETTPQLQNIVISQGHSESEVIEILNALNRHCRNPRQIQLELTATIAKHLITQTELTDKIESLRLHLVPENSQKEVFKSLSYYKKLREITFIDANPKPVYFQLFLSSCPNLEHLNVSNDTFCKSNFVSLLKMKDKFRSLRLRIDKLDRSSITELSSFARLERLHLVDINASLDKLVEIGQLPCLETLLLKEDASSPVLTSSSVAEFLRCGTFANLKELKLHKSRLNDEGAAEIRRNCPVLTYLEVITYPKSRSGLTEKALVHFLHCKRLENFEVTFDSSNETDWIYRRIQYVKHECDIDGVCPIDLHELLLAWDEIQIPID